MSKPWTDYELGFIQDNDGWTALQIAEALGRGEAAVTRRRWQLRKGWTPTREAGRAWSKAEDEFLLTNPTMRAIDVGSSLGRREGSVRRRRSKLRADGMVDKAFGGNVSPWSVGARPLLARTCPACGLLLPALWFSASNGGRARTCGRCFGVRTRDKGPRQPSEADKRSQIAARARLQAITTSSASNSGQPWTEADFAVLSNPDMTILQKALTLRRTYTAVAVKCSREGVKSVVGLGDPERDQWLIDNPNADRLDEITASLAVETREAPEADEPRPAPSWDWDDADLVVSA